MSQSNENTTGHKRSAYRLARFRGFTTTRRGVLIGSLVIVSLGVVTWWDWMVAAGLAPILISVGPCLVMCGLGLCMHRTDCNKAD